MENTDLPMLSNIDKFKVKHYIFKYDIDMNKNVLLNETILLITECPEVQSTIKIIGNEEKLILDEGYIDLILDCCDLDVLNVYEISGTDKMVDEYIHDYLSWNNEGISFWKRQSQQQCKFTVNKWSLCINLKPNMRKYIVLRIISSSTDIGLSVNWRRDEDNNKCLFTAGSQINNRSIMPAQDNPNAMATWEGSFYVPSLYYVSCTGDRAPSITYNKTCDINCYYYSTFMPMPIATFALAVGKWIHKEIISKTITEHSALALKYPSHPEIECNHEPYMCNMKHRDSGPLIDVSVIAPLSIIDKAVNILQHCRSILISTYHLLGNHPLNRLQFIVLPRSFNCLGLASPNIIFISPTLLCDDSNTYINLAHEISHTWFGILIGPKNWNEEWLTEGFATYLETHIYTESLKFAGNIGLLKTSQLASVTEEIIKDLVQIRGCIKYQKLKDEEANTSETLQSLAPPSVYSSVTKNALDSSKAFLQVHYLKGYFLLQYLSQLVGVDNFAHFLKLYIAKFHGCLITADDYFELFYELFPHIGDIISYQTIVTEWLSNPKINQTTRDLGKINKTNRLISQVLEHFAYIKKFNENVAPPKLDFLFSDQIVLLFEFVLELETVSHPVLEYICSFYKVPDQNAEVRHRWCELVVKHNYQNVKDVELFLIQDQSMGVYLYGEMMLSSNPAHGKLAKDIFSYLKSELDPSSKQIILEMLYDN